MDTQTKAAGRCSCGAVKILITLPVKGCVHCHCAACRQAHGAAFVTWVSIPRGRFQLSGREHLRWYQDTPNSRRGFCGRCGSPMLFMADRWPDDVHVARACIFTDVDMAPKVHLSFDQRVSWFPFEDALPCLGTEMERLR